MGSIPLLTGIAGTLLGHRITAAWLISTVACAAGLVLLGYQGVSGGESLGVLAAIVAATAGAAFTLTVKRVIERGGQPDLAQAALYIVAGGVMLGSALSTAQFAWVTTPRGAALALWLGVVTMALPNALWVRGLGVLSPGVTATLLIGEPLTATVLGVVLLDEHLTTVSWFGLTIVAAGLIALGFSASKEDVPLLHE
jgi:DME family drug/metabolite transporter